MCSTSGMAAAQSGATRAGEGRRTLEHAVVELVGFYSRQHRGIFTPRESNVHVHLRTEDGRISGHLETIRLAPGAGRVPVAGWSQ